VKENKNCRFYSLAVYAKGAELIEESSRQKTHAHLKRNLFFQRRGIWIDSAKEPKAMEGKTEGKEQTKRKAENRNLVDLPRIHT
jgi:hypothetical protein